MDAHRTVQGTAAISTTMRGLCGAAVATPICSCRPTKLLPRDKKRSPQELRPLSSPVNGQNSRWPVRTRSSDEVIPKGVKLVKEGSLARREIPAFENQVRVDSAGATGLATSGMSLITMQAQAIDWAGQR